MPFLFGGEEPLGGNFGRGSSEVVVYGFFSIFSSGGQYVLRESKHLGNFGRGHYEEVHLCEIDKLFVCLFGLCFNVPVNSYGHVEMVS